MDSALKERKEGGKRDNNEREKKRSWGTDKVKKKEARARAHPPPQAPLAVEALSDPLTQVRSWPMARVLLSCRSTRWLHHNFPLLLPGLLACQQSARGFSVCVFVGTVPGLSKYANYPEYESALLTCEILAAVSLPSQPTICPWPWQARPSLVSCHKVVHSS